MQGISTRSVDDLVKAMGMSGVSKSQVSRLCEEIDGKVKAFLERPLEGDWPYLWIDATYLKVRRGGRIVSVAVIIAVGVNSDGRREVLGMEIGTSEAEPIWTEFLRKEKLYGNDNPVFPRTWVQLNAEGCFGTDGLEPVFWENTEPIRRIFRAAFAAAGLPYFRLHSFRDTLVHFGERYAPTIVHFKAWSQNLGHEHVRTTLTSYGSLSPHRQGELVRSMHGADSRDENDPEMRVLFEQFMRMVKSSKR